MRGILRKVDVRDGMFGITLTLILFLFMLAVFGGIMWVAVHFAIKYW